MSTDPTRRDFFAAAGSSVAAAWITANLSGIRDAAAHAARAVRAGPTGFETLAPDEAADLAALADQFFPSEPGSPGAREAGVVHFLDRALGSFAGYLAEPLRAGLTEINRLAAGRHPPARRFADLDPAAGEALMPAIAALPAFPVLQMLVAAGMFADPSYGGNTGKVGWTLLGFDDRFAWQPPFGYYDREAHGTPGEDRR